MTNYIQEDAFENLRNQYVYRYRAQELARQCDLAYEMIECSNLIQDAWMKGSSLFRGPDGRFTSQSSDTDVKRSDAPMTPGQMDEIVKQNSSTGGKGQKEPDPSSGNNPVSTPSKDDVNTSLSETGDSEKPAKDVVDEKYGAGFQKAKDAIGESLGNAGNAILDSITAAFHTGMDLGESAGNAISSGLKAAQDLAGAAYAEAKENGNAFGEMAAVAGAAILRAPLANSKDAGDLIMSEAKAAFADTKARYEAKRSDRAAKNDTNFVSPEEVQKLEDSMSKTEQALQATISENMDKNQKKAALLAEKNPTQKTQKEAAQAAVEDLAQKNQKLESDLKGKQARVEELQKDLASVSEQRNQYSAMIDEMNDQQNELTSQLVGKEKEIDAKSAKVQELQEKIASVQKDLEDEKISKENADAMIQQSQDALEDAIADADFAFEEADKYKEQMIKNYEDAQAARKENEEKMDAIRKRFDEAYPNWRDDILSTSLNKKDVNQMVSGQKDKKEQEKLDKMKKEIEKSEKRLAVRKQLRENTWSDWK